MKFKMSISKQNISKMACTICVVTTAACHNPVPPPEYKINQHPNEKYKVIVKSDYDISGTVSVIAWYHIINGEKCVPIDYTIAFGGIRPDPKVKYHYNIKKINNDEFSSIFYLDIINPGDYWGKGICSWGIYFLEVQFSHAGVEYEAYLTRNDFGQEKKFRCLGVIALNDRPRSCDSNFRAKSSQISSDLVVISRREEK